LYRGAPARTARSLFARPGDSGLAEVAGDVTTVNETYDRVAMHGVRSELLDRQIAALNVPAIKVLIPGPCTNEIYEARMADACAAIKASGVYHIIFGDLFLEDIRAYRERTLAALGMTPIFPLWGRNTRRLAAEMIDSGLVARLACLDPKQIPASFAGRRFDAALLQEIPPHVDPCGEKGEFHTVVTEGPMFSAPIGVSIGQTVERDGFVFTDVIPD
jgi:diphthamide synthase (EF-2-diphthine--ammonia ligase)